jgi:hypothetical protein
MIVVNIIIGVVAVAASLFILRFIVRETISAFRNVFGRH